MPWRTSSISRIMFGWMIVPMIPPIRMWTPKTASSSGWDQPLSSVVWLNTRPMTASPVPSAIADWKIWIAKFARYWSSFSAPTRKNSPNSRSGRSGSRRAARRHVSCPPRNSAGSRTARRRARRSSRSRSRAPASPRPPSSSASGRSADERLDRKPERPLERQDVGQLLRPVGHQRERHEPAGQQQFGGEHQLEDRSDPGRPERHHPEHPVVHRTDEVGAPDRDGEHDHVDRARVELR